MHSVRPYKKSLTTWPDSKINPGFNSIPNLLEPTSQDVYTGFSFSVPNEHPLPFHTKENKKIRFESRVVGDAYLI